MRKLLKKITIIVLTISMVSMLAPAGAAWADVSMQVSVPWVGSGTEDDPYLIQNKEDLTELAGFVNNGSLSGSYKYFKQLNDIDLSDAKWTPIGNSSGRYFCGVYDGNSKGITNMTVEGTDYLGLFGHIASLNAEKGTVIRDLSVSGSITVQNGSGLTIYRSIGGIAGNIGRNVTGDTDIPAKVYITNCVSDVDITSSKTGNGGIAGKIDNSTVITDCMNRGDLNLSLSGNAYGNEGSGGIVGCFLADGGITGCVNTGNITNTGSGENSMGGMVGNTNTSTDLTIAYCYNTGNISTASSYKSDGAGGIIGTRTNYVDANLSNGSEVIIHHCYNAGTISASNKEGKAAGGIIGCTLKSDPYGSPVITQTNTYKVFSLQNAAAKLICNDGGGESASGIGLENGGIFSASPTSYAGIVWLLEQLSDDEGYFKKDSNYVNDGFPLLKWQDEGDPIEGSFGRAAFDMAYDNEANLTADEKAIIKVDGKEVSGNAYVLAEGSHSYEITLKGYEEAKGTFEVNADPAIVQVIPVKLTAKYYTWILTIDPKNSDFALKNSDGEVVDSYSAGNGVYTYMLYNGQYTATASCDGYFDKTAEFRVAFNNGDDRLRLTAIPETYPQEPELSSDGYYLIYKPQELSWINYMATSVDQDAADMMARANIMLMADIDMTGYDWMPMNGTELAAYLRYGYYSGGCYSGIFEGNGHIISNLTLNRENIAESSYVFSRADGIGMLFGWTKNAQISKVGITGSMHISDAPASGYGDFCHIGGIVGMAQSMTEISECFTDVDIVFDVTKNEAGNPVGYYYASDTYIGGIAGSLTTGSVVTDSYSKGNIYGEGTNSVNIGGIAGSTRGDYHVYDDATNELIYTQHDMIIRCYSISDITSEPYSSGYLGGIVGLVRGSNIGEIPEIYENFALNKVIDGNGKCIANRILGNSYAFEDSGYYNYALDTMDIRNADVQEDEANYKSSMGLDITDTKAKLAGEYDNLGWKAEIWNLDVLNDYPHLLWENLEKHIHTYKEEIIPPTCYEYGYTIYTCSECGEQTTGNFTAPGEHEWGEWEESTERTNSHVHVCVKCGAVETKTHEWGEGVVTKAATASEDGVMTYTCAVCHSEKISVIPGTGKEDEKDDPAKQDDKPEADEPAKQDDTPSQDDPAKQDDTPSQEEPIKQDEKPSQEEPAKQDVTPSLDEPTTRTGEPAVSEEEPATQPATPGTMFVDVADNSNIYKPVAWAVNEGIIKGYSDNTFRPEDSCTREQFAIMMWRFADKPEADISAANRFTDIDDFSNNTSRRAVAWAVEEGIIQGFSDGHFGPKETVTRRQVVIMLWRWTGRPAATEAADFSDVDTSESTYRAIQWGSETGMVRGYSDGTFKPEADCQRQHIVIFLYRYAREILKETVS